MAQNRIVRVLSRLDIKGPHVVKTVHAEGLRVVGEPRVLAARYYEAWVDGIIYMDIVASLYEREFDFEQLKRVTEGLFIPLTVGGGMRSVSDIDRALRSGADKVAINTHAVYNPPLIEEAAKRFGSQCVVLSVEAKAVGEERWEAYTEGGREPSGKDVVEWVREATARGAGEILLTSIDRDGTKKGYDIDLIQAVRAASPVPVIAHGGAGTVEDIVDAVLATDAKAISASTLFHYDLASVGEVKRALAAAGVPVRL